MSKPRRAPQRPQRSETDGPAVPTLIGFGTAMVECTLEFFQENSSAGCAVPIFAMGPPLRPDPHPPCGLTHVHRPAFMSGQLERIIVAHGQLKAALAF